MEIISWTSPNKWMSVWLLLIRVSSLLCVEISFNLNLKTNTNACTFIGWSIVTREDRLVKWKTRSCVQEAVAARSSPMYELIGLLPTNHDTVTPPICAQMYRHTPPPTHTMAWLKPPPHNDTVIRTHLDIAALKASALSLLPDHRPADGTMPCGNQWRAAHVGSVKWYSDDQML